MEKEEELQFNFLVGGVVKMKLCEVIIAVGANFYFLLKLHAPIKSF